MPESSDLEEYDPNGVPPAQGFNNTGVICHFNSLLQSLLSCSSFVQAVKANKKHMELTATGRALSACVGAAQPQASATILKALVSDLRVRAPRVKYGPSQESASEGLVLLLDMLDDPAGKSNNPLTRLFTHRGDAQVYCRVCEAWVSREIDTGVQINLFHYDAAPPGTPLESIIRTHTSRLDDYKCDTCGTVANRQRVYRMRMIPEILVCVFNLYGAERPVRPFPTEMQFASACGGQLVYKQVAQVEHSGGLGGGHYVAKGLRGGRVHRFNDSSVAPGAFGPAPGVYMVFYHYALTSRS